MYVRQAAVAGRFYPSEPDRLRDLVTSYIDRAEPAIPDKPFGMIAPHAGYPYSGPVAGWSYRQIVGHTYGTVIVLAPSHNELFSFASVMTDGVYRTPLGDVPIDERFAEKLLDKVGDTTVAKSSHRGHSDEHSLEVQLPFLQVALADFLLVPIVVGRIIWEQCQQLGRAIADSVEGNDVLVVASSDLSHYHSYDKAYSLDRKVIERVKKLDAQGIADGCRTGDLEACGGSPISIMLTAAEQKNARHVEILRYATSGDVPEGSRDQVVGYLAAAVYEAQIDVDPK